jgi:nitrite reductase/ring-hydroxylating ferredoxin subunit
MAKVRICAVDELEEGTARKFEFKRGGRVVEGFAAQFKGEFVAYENVCRHIAISLDYGDNRFFSRDGRHFICQTHGAIYEPLSGLCVRGPCEGDRLKRLEITVADGVIWLV